jgi:hypothetical protein
MLSFVLYYKEHSRCQRQGSNRTPTQHVLSLTATPGSLVIVSQVRVHCGILVTSTAGNINGTMCPGLERNLAEGNLSFQVHYIWLWWSPNAFPVCVCLSVRLSLSVHNIPLHWMGKYIDMWHWNVIMLAQTGRHRIEKVYCSLANFFPFYAHSMFLKSVSKSWGIYVFWAQFNRKMISYIIYACRYEYAENYIHTPS